MELIIKFNYMKNDKVVYAFLREDDTPFYIGMGSMDRARNHKKGSRNYRWWEEMKSNPNYKFKIVDRSLTKQQAWDIELDLISEFGRQHIDADGILTNIHPGGSFYGDHVTVSVVAFNLKGYKFKTYESIREAHRNHGSNPMAGAIGTCAKYQQKSFDGYQWFYESEVGDIDYIGPVKRKKNNGGHNTSKTHYLDFMSLKTFESQHSHAKFVLGDDNYYTGSQNKKECVDRRFYLSEEEYIYF